MQPVTRSSPPYDENQRRRALNPSVSGPLTHSRAPKRVAGDLKVCFLQQQALEGKTPAVCSLRRPPPHQPQAYSSQLCINTPKQNQTQISIWIQSTQRKVGPIKHLIANYGIMFGLQQTVKAYGTTTVAAYGNAFKVSTLTNSRPAVN